MARTNQKGTRIEQERAKAKRGTSIPITQTSDEGSRPEGAFNAPHKPKRQRDLFSSMIDRGQRSKRT